MKRRTLATALAVPLALGLTTMSACAPSSGGGGGAETTNASELGISDEDYSLDKLVEAAKQEGPLTVTDTTGKIEDIAKAFSEEYGIETTGTKLKAHQMTEIAEREAKAGNVQTDVFFHTSPAEVVAELLPSGNVVSWMPPDLTDQVPEEFQDPVMVTQEPITFLYNTTKYPDGCPVDNIWDVMDEEWQGKVAIPDPTLYDYMPGFWNQMANLHDDEMAQAYEDKYGKALETDEDTATNEYVKQFAATKPLVTKSNDDVSDAVGSPDQDDPFFGFASVAKIRDNDEKGYTMAVCDGMAPYTGVAYTKAGVIAAGTESPNAAKLFVHYMLTKDGIWDQTVDGKISTNTTVPENPDDPTGVRDVWDQIYVFDPKNLQSDYDNQQKWLDFWRTNNG